LLSLVASVLVVVTTVTAHADTPPAPAPTEIGPEEALNAKIAVWRFDALGIDTELVARLETLFRMELDRLDKQPLPNRRDIERLVPSSLANCTGEEKCLAEIGKKLGVDIVVTGTVGAMGDNYVLNIKAVETATAKQVQRIQSDPLRGSPDELIEGVRVAAYKLLAPAQIHGALQIQTDLVGASVALDGLVIGKTPLPKLGVVGKLTLGKHKLHVEANGYSPIDEEVDVHFQKVSQVLVRLLPSTEVIGTGKITRIERKPIYTRTWFIVAAGVVAVGLGALIGEASGHIKICDVTSQGTTCH
jgi:hypothetical protein